MADLVAVHRRLMRHLGIERLHAAVGGSLGGMQVLQWVVDAPDEIERAVLVAASSQLSAENIGFSAVAREAIMGDPDFHDGRYVDHGVVPAHGLKVARMMAHITYVSDESLARKFGRRRVEGVGRTGSESTSRWRAICITRATRSSGASMRSPTSTSPDFSTTSTRSPTRRPWHGCGRR
ncbi:alpha/beta fold hydrolase [Nocardioides alcanivorans]|uniref:alpha/beta fold hydrolase n=1 Tax=Nocardioides alcanivorans TaxID=2897352 RepID=UPI0035DA5CFC